MATTVELTDNALPVHDSPKAFSDEQVENVKHIVTAGAESFQPEEGVEYNVTFKTWVVIFMLTVTGSVSYWSVPCLAGIQNKIALELGDATHGTWITAVYNLGAVVAFLVCGPNSDLFGRRYFILFGNLLVVLGGIVGGSAKSTTALIAAMAITGFGGGNCQLTAFALPELLPNKYRPAAVVLVDSINYIDLIVGPVAGRYAVAHGEWRWLLYGMSIVMGGSGIGIAALYFPPKHPRGIPWRQALHDLDYVGALAFTAAANLILTGIVYASYTPASSPTVVICLAVGFAMLTIFACWETYVPLKEPLTPPHIFRRNYGRTFTAPFIASMMVSMFYLGTLTVWGIMVDVFFTSSTSGNKDLKLSLAQGFGVLVGAMGLAGPGHWIKHWKWQMFGSTLTATLFGALLALGNPHRQGMCIAFTFLSSAGYGWGQYLSIAYIQFGADQIELGIVGGLGGVARFAGGAVAQTVFITIIDNVVRSNAKVKVIAAAIAAGASKQTAQQVLAALPLGSAAVMKVSGITAAIAEAAGAAYVDSYAVGLKTVALVSIAFGVVGMTACLCLEDIEPKMTKKIEVFLENDVNAEKNKFH